MRETPLNALDYATLRYVLADAGEGDGWLDLTRVQQRDGRMLPRARLVAACAAPALDPRREGRAHAALMRFSLAPGGTPRLRAAKEPVA